MRFSRLFCGGATANKRLWDGDLIAKTTELSNDAAFMGRLGNDIQTQSAALKSIISKNVRAGCNTCLPPSNISNAHLKLIDLRLEQTPRR